MRVARFLGGAFLRSTYRTHAHNADHDLRDFAPELFGKCLGVEICAMRRAKQRRGAYRRSVELEPCDNRRGAEHAIEPRFTIGRAEVSVQWTRNVERRRDRAPLVRGVGSTGSLEPRGDRLGRSSFRRGMQYGNHADDYTGRRGGSMSTVLLS